MHPAAAGAHSRMLFCKIPGVGAGTAAKWYDLGYRCVLVRRWGQAKAVVHGAALALTCTAWGSSLDSTSQQCRHCATLLVLVQPHAIIVPALFPTPTRTGQCAYNGQKIHTGRFETGHSLASH